MTHDRGVQAVAVPMDNLGNEPHGRVHTVPPGWAGSGSPSTSRRLLLLSSVIAGLVLCAVVLFLALRWIHPRHAAAGTGASPRDEADGNKFASLPVNTVRPRLKTLERTLEQPGSIQPWAQAELYAKLSGYLKTIQRTTTPRVAANLVADLLATSGPPVVAAARRAVAIELALWQAPQKDIGSRVRAGELLMEIAAPERYQEIAEKESLVHQRQAELEAARTALTTYEAAVEAAKAQVRKSASEYAFRKGELKRLQELVLARTVTQEVADEKLNQANAAQAAWDSSQADLAVVSSKLATGRADVKVKEALVQVAQDQLRSARVMAEYCLLRAPFDGIITYRGVDEGDFVQNATSGQARRLMTITAMDYVRVTLQVPEREAAWVQVGAEAIVMMDARTSWQVKGYVARIAQSLDAQTRTMQVEIDLDNRDLQLRPGMYGHVIVVLQRIPNAQAIPATALYNQKGGNLILQVQDNVARRHRVRVRYDDGKEVEVVKLIGEKELPLDGTEELIVSNKGEIADGQRVKPAPANRP